MFTHASVDLTSAQAAIAIAHLRSLARSQAPEFKSEQLLRPQNRDALLWLIGPQGPLRGHALTYLVDKDYFVVGKVIDLLVEEVAHAAGRDLYADGKARELAWMLHREGRRALGATDWATLLTAFNSLMRIKQRKGVKATVDDFFNVVDGVRLKSTRRAVEAVLTVVWQARPHAEQFQGRLLDSDVIPALDPLMAALPVTVGTWAARTGRPVRVVHDTQAALTEGRVKVLIRSLARPHPDFARFVAPVRLLAVEQVDSRIDPRVQVADLLAGASRIIATDALTGTADPELCEALRHLIGVESLWSDDQSWHALTGQEAVGGETTPHAQRRHRSASTVGGRPIGVRTLEP